MVLRLLAAGYKPRCNNVCLAHRLVGARSCDSVRQTLMKPFDLNAYDKRVFGAIAKLIHERDPSLGEDEIEREALDLMGDHVRAASVLSLLRPISKRRDLARIIHSMT